MLFSKQILDEPNLEERVLEVARDYGLDIEDELEEIDVKYLGTYVNARTSKRGKLRIDFDSQNFFSMSEEEQRRTILHELIHVMQFTDSLSDWAQEEFDVSDEFAEKLDGTIWEDVRSVEGETELILGNLFPDQDSSYPYAEKSKEKELKSDGIDIQSEIGEKIDEEAEDILDNYREVEEVEITRNSYLERGSIGDLDYEVAAIGEDAPVKGPRQVEEYLVDRIEEIDYSPAPDYKPLETEL